MSEKEVTEYVAACPVCARIKVTKCPALDRFHLLTVQYRPESDISVVVVTGLPPSDDNTVIITVMDRFSKMDLFFFVDS